MVGGCIVCVFYIGRIYVRAGEEQDIHLFFAYFNKIRKFSGVHSVELNNIIVFLCEC